MQSVAIYKQFENFYSAKEKSRVETKARLIFSGNQPSSIHQLELMKINLYSPPLLTHFASVITKPVLPVDQRVSSTRLPPLTNGESSCPDATVAPNR
jgi:hypothetical protein